MSNEKKDRPVHQGQIYYVDFSDEDGETGSVQKGTRPVIVISNESMNRRASICIVAKITSQKKRLDLDTHVMLPKIKGLPKQSMVLAEHQRTISKDRLLKYRCQVDEETFAKVKKAVRAATAKGRPRRTWK